MHVINFLHALLKVLLVVASLAFALRVSKSFCVNAIGCKLLASVNMVAVITHAFRVVFCIGMLAIRDNSAFTTFPRLCSNRLGHHLSWSHHLVILKESTTLRLLF